MVIDFTSSNIDEVLLINPSATVFVFGNFKIHNKDWLTNLGGTDRPGQLCYNFSVLNDLTQMDPTPIPDCDCLIVLLFWIYFYLLALVFVLQCISLNWETLIMLS